MHGTDQALHVAVVAEGIETARQADYLEAIGCQYGQGYHVARPQDARTVEAGLAASVDVGRETRKQP